ncbi:hypothetical protein ASF11_22645 [Acidovorax sp. Leaf76]|uniref:DUF1090 domain-containing protein n=1 Tax=unclassified Acidovorax TaxID=2684926 RepID=UPI0006FE1929|nr:MULTISPECIES: DUF1090 domain-containing protein [unclassified Acidovorax]KQO24086.1 hypothetical protein ASF11_22645 [Acidovorax sp. Leaf76]KQO38536.1 hypothetical protein ASF19_19800 [Acidovorax sp. Leaf84]KQS40897.1 hypothetical protein ASG27_21205 [Acidovorax sp. Leaf191]
MKNLVVGVCLLALHAAPALAADASPACAAKQARIEAQLAEATAQGRTREVAGLRQARRSNKAHCTDAWLAKERDAEIRKATKKVAEREKSLAEAQKKGDAKKIAARQAKLDEARSALAEAQKPL